MSAEKKSPFRRLLGRSKSADRSVALTSTKPIIRSEASSLRVPNRIEETLTKDGEDAVEVSQTVDERKAVESVSLAGDLNETDQRDAEDGAIAVSVAEPSP